MWSGNRLNMCYTTLIFTVYKFMYFPFFLSSSVCFTSPCLFLYLEFLGFPLSGDQSLGCLRSNRLSDRPHRLLHRHRGGGTGWDQIPSDQTEYPEELYKIHLVRQTW